MKKYTIIVTAFFLMYMSNACSERDLDLYPPFADDITNINSEAQLQQLLNGGYISTASTDAYGTKLMLLGDLLSDNMFVSNFNPSFLDTYNFNYNAAQNEFSFYDSLYNAIAKCNLVINNATVANNQNVTRIKGEAKILRALAYFTLVNYYSATPTSGVNQDYGVPLVLENYDVNAQPARATVAQVYSQIIADLQDGITQAADVPTSKRTFSKTAAKLLLAKVYLTRRASGDAALALQYSTDIVDNSPSVFAKINANALTKPYNPNSVSVYQQYFNGNNDGRISGSEVYQGNTQNYVIEGSENQPETIWELDLNSNTNQLTGIGSNVSLPGYYNRIDSRKCMLFNQSFYSSFGTNDVRKGTSPTVVSNLLISIGVPSVDNPRGYWTNKYPRLTERGNYFRNIKVFRFADAQLLQIEALHLTGQDGIALTKLNTFAASRNGSTYTGTNILNDILTERSKEFYAEGQRFLDLKRYNISVVRPSNCLTCTVSANDKRFVLPVSQTALNRNPNLTQYPGY